MAEGDDTFWWMIQHHLKWAADAADRNDLPEVIRHLKGALRWTLMGAAMSEPPRVQVEAPRVEMEAAPEPSVLAGAVAVGRGLLALTGPAYALDAESRVRARHMVHVQSSIPDLLSNHTHLLFGIDLAPPERAEVQQFTHAGAAETTWELHLVDSKAGDPRHARTPTHLGMSAAFNADGLTRATLGRRDDCIEVVPGVGFRFAEAGKEVVLTLADLASLRNLQPPPNPGSEVTPLDTKRIG